MLVSPDHYDISYAINPHMTDVSGELKRPVLELAKAQWDALRRAYESIGYPATILPGLPGLPDMVFCANVALPVPAREPGRPLRVILSRMRHGERDAEVEAARQWFAARGDEVLEIGKGACLEAHGDLVWFPGRRLLVGGHGFRTDRAALDEVAALGDVPVFALRLLDETFYHLDTCLSPLDEDSALWVPEAFDARGRALLERLFPRLLDVDPGEARDHLAVNAHCPDGRNVIIDAGATRTISALGGAGFRVHPVDTSEFLKAGGSVFCMKLMLP